MPRGRGRGGLIGVISVHIPLIFIRMLTLRGLIRVFNVVRVIGMMGIVRDIDAIDVLEIQLINELVAFRVIKVMS